MTKKSIWISYDFGIKGDFPGLYAWLDNHQAKESGNNLAYLQYEFEGKTDEDLLNSLEKDLTNNVKIEPGDRVYVIRLREDNSITNIKPKISGRFIIGNRKASPWEGYGEQDNSINDGDE